MDIIIGIGIFIVVLLLIEAAYFSLRTSRGPEKKAVKRRLRTLSVSKIEDESIDILQKKFLSEIPWFNRLLLSFNWTGRLNRLLEQANVKYPLGVYILLTFLLAFAGLLVSSWLTSNYLIIIPVTVILGMIPFFYVYTKKKRRMDKFQRQFPEALDLVARALRAGHAFTGGLKMVADEMGDPVGTEFDKTLNEINFGIGIPEALKGLSNRVDCPDLKFFVISVIIQRETGGNLAEILDNIAHLIRERFKLFGHIRVLAAQGKLSATILIGLPFVVAIVLSFINPKYIGTLSTDPIGRILVIFALIMMIFGVFVMRRIIAIKV
jgi:tight adherence protein B